GRTSLPTRSCSSSTGATARAGTTQAPASWVGTRRDGRTWHEPERCSGTGGSSTGGVAGTPPALRGPLRRGRHELRAVLRGRGARRSVPLRRGRPRGARHVRRGRRPPLALVPARRVTRAALRLPGERPLGPRQGAVVQPGEAAARPVRHGGRGRGRLGPGL